MVKIVGLLSSLSTVLFYRNNNQQKHQLRSSKSMVIIRSRSTREATTNDIGTIWNGPLDIKDIVPSAPEVDEEDIDEENENENDDDDDDVDNSNNSSTSTDSVRICFRNLTDETLVLCWVDTNGVPHHFYQLRPYRSISKLRTTLTSTNQNDNNDDESVMIESEYDHIETSCCGHVFIVVTQPSSNSLMNHNKKSLQDATIIGAYRPDHIVPQRVEATSVASSSDTKNRSNYLHLVTIHDPRPNHHHSLHNAIQRLFRGCCLPSRINKNRDNILLHDENDDDDESYHLEVRFVRLVCNTAEVLDTTNKHYEYSTIGQCQWPIFAEPNWYGYDIQLKNLFASDLDMAISYLPHHCRTVLRDTSPTPFWMNRSLKYGSKYRPIEGKGMCFHPHQDWLIENGCHAEKSECIELYQAKEYKTSRLLWGPGGLLLHELCHAYHHKCIPNGYNNHDIIKCYKDAMKEGIYNKVRVKGKQGPYAKAYACENAMEYFAELSTAFLGGITTENNQDGVGENLDETAQSSKTEQKQTKKTHGSIEEFNKWYPFNRQQLREHDPRAYEMLKKVWKISIND
jgi:hypothetical protein